MTDLDPELAEALAGMRKGDNGSVLDLTDIPALRRQLAAGTGVASGAGGGSPGHRLASAFEETWRELLLRHLHG